MFSDLNLNLIADPPGAPNITGLSSDTVLIEGQIRRLTCISMAGNPLADLTWFRGDEELSQAVTVKGENGDYSKSDLTITVNRKDNGQAYKCKASNSATDENSQQPLTTSLPLSVRFKPESVKITVEPAEPKAGQKANLICESGTSNPQSRIVWRYKHETYNGTTESVKDGEFGGKITKNILQRTIHPEDHGAIIICEAINDDLQESVHNAITLSVKCKSYHRSISKIKCGLWQWSFTWKPFMEN